MDDISKDCEGWSDYDLKRLKLYIATTNRIRNMPRSEIEENILFGTFRFKDNCNCDFIEKLELLREVYLWIQLISNHDCDVLDLFDLKYSIDEFLINNYNES